MFRCAGIEPRLLLGILAGVTFVCCGGVFIAGYTIASGAKGAFDVAGNTAETALEEIGSSWSADVAPRWFSDAIVSNPGKMAELHRAFQQYKSALGPMKQHDPCRFQGIDTFTGTDGRTITILTTRCHAVFEKGSGYVRLKMRKEGEDWKIISFYIDADALR